MRSNHSSLRGILPFAVLILSFNAFMSYPLHFSRTSQFSSSGESRTSALSLPQCMHGSTIVGTTCGLCNMIRCLYISKFKDFLGGGYNKMFVALITIVTSISLFKGDFTHPLVRLSVPLLVTVRNRRRRFNCKGTGRMTCARNISTW